MTLWDWSAAPEKHREKTPGTSKNDSEVTAVEMEVYNQNVFAASALGLAEPSREIIPHAMQPE